MHFGTNFTQTEVFEVFVHQIIVYPYTHLYIRVSRNFNPLEQKSCIRKTPNLSTDVDSSTDVFVSSGVK